jgi:uncharacterized protein (DUF952 family)
MSEWNECENQPWYKPHNFAEDGFIHCCSKRQLKGVLERYFSGRADLLMLTINERKLLAELKYEQGPGNDRFPHIYGMIDKHAIVKIGSVVE